MITNEDLEAMGYPVYDRQAHLRKMSVMDMVYEFASVMKQPKNPDMSSKLIGEEYWEWADTSGAGLAHEYELKELADLVYVIYGYARVMGWDLDEAIRRIHTNNLERCVWPDGSIKYREDGKVEKRPDAPKVDLSDLV